MAIARSHTSTITTTTTTSGINQKLKEAAEENEALLAENKKLLVDNENLRVRNHEIKRELEEAYRQLWSEKIEGVGAKDLECALFIQAFTPLSGLNSTDSW